MNQIIFSFTTQKHDSNKMNYLALPIIRNSPLFCFVVYEFYASFLIKNHSIKNYIYVES